MNARKGTAGKVRNERDNARTGSVLTAKEYLMQYREAMRRTKAIAAHIAELRAVCEQLRTEDGRRIALDKAVAALVDAQEKAQSEITRLAGLEDEILYTLSRIQEPYRTLLFERYINGNTFEQIAVRMHYSWRQIIRLHGQALCIVQNVMECHI